MSSNYARTLPRVLSTRMFSVETLDDERTPTKGARKQPRPVSLDRIRGFQLHQENEVDPLLDRRFTATQQLIWELYSQGYSKAAIAKLVSIPREFYFVKVADVELALKCVKEVIN